MPELKIYAPLPKDVRFISPLFIKPGYEYELDYHLGIVPGIEPTRIPQGEHIKKYLETLGDFNFLIQESVSPYTIRFTYVSVSIPSLDLDTVLEKIYTIYYYNAGVIFDPQLIFRNQIREPDWAVPDIVTPIKEPISFAKNVNIGRGEPTYPEWPKPSPLPTIPSPISTEIPPYKTPEEALDKTKIHFPWWLLLVGGLLAFVFIKGKKGKK